MLAVPARITRMATTTRTSISVKPRRTRRLWRRFRIMRFRPEWKVVRFGYRISPQHERAMRVRAFHPSPGFAGEETGVRALECDVSKTLTPNPSPAKPGEGDQVIPLAGHCPS